MSTPSNPATSSDSGLTTENARSPEWAASLRTLLRFNHHMLLGTARDLDARAMETPIVPGGNTPRWILIHLAVGLDFALMAIGRPTLLPRPYLSSYGPGSTGRLDPEHSPTPQQALEMIAAGVEAVDSALGSLDASHAARFARPHAAKALVGTPLVSIGDTVAHLVSTHFALHIGQLSLARRALGHKPLI